MDEIYNKISDPDEWGIESNEKSEIQGFYAQQTVFLTGCTGFVGKCVVEKLLRACPDLKKLYLMVRPKKVSAKERIEKYFDDILFEKLRELRPNFKSKVTVIEGCLDKDNLGLSDEDKNTIINEATIFLHNASNVKFELRISESLSCNVFGTKNMLDLAKECKHLKVFVYVSTAYSHCYQKQIFEKCYPPPGDLKLIQDCINVDRETPNGMSDRAIQEFIAPWPNMYVFGKATAESLVEQYAKVVPFRCTIFRPTMIMSSYQEPIPSWTDNINGPVLGLVGVGVGIVHVGYIANRTIDFVPVDMCTNGLLATTWDATINRKEVGSALVYNYGSSVVNPIDLLTFEGWVNKRGVSFPSNKMIGPHFTYVSNWKVIFIIAHILFHCIPAAFADIGLLASGRKPLALSILYKATKRLPELFFFMNGNWRMYVTETTKVWDRMNKRDHELFYNDLRTLKWDVYAYNYWIGLRLYILKDPMSTLYQARIRHNLFAGIFYILCAAIISIFLYCCREFILLLLIPFYNLAKLLFVHNKC